MRHRAGISRRTFIGAGAAAAAFAMVGSGRTIAQGVPGRDSIVVAKNGTASELVLGAVTALGGMDSFVGAGDTVLVKPNASFSLPPETGANTNPEVAAAVISLCLQAGADKVILADHTIDAHATVFVNGIEETAKACGGEFVGLRRQTDFQEVGIDGGLRLTSVDAAKVYLESDVLINLPVLKHHSSTGSCAGLKNLMGLVYDRGVFHNRGLFETIADLSLAIRPDLTIIDATRVIWANGPRGPSPGGPLEIGRVVAGVDPVSVDVTALGLVSSLGHTDFEVSDDWNAYIPFADDLGVGDGNAASVADRTVEWDASEEGGGCIVEPPPKGLPGWVPYGAISATSVGLGILAMAYDRRRKTDA